MRKIVGVAFCDDITYLNRIIQVVTSLGHTIRICMPDEYREECNVLVMGTKKHYNGVSYGNKVGNVAPSLPIDNNLSLFTMDVLSNYEQQNIPIIALGNAPLYLSRKLQFTVEHFNTKLLSVQFKAVCNDAVMQIDLEQHITKTTNRYFSVLANAINENTILVGSYNNYFISRLDLDSKNGVDIFKYFLGSNSSNIDPDDVFSQIIAW